MCPDVPSARQNKHTTQTTNQLLGKVRHATVIAVGSLQYAWKLSQPAWGLWKGIIHWRKTFQKEIWSIWIFQVISVPCVCIRFRQNPLVALQDGEQLSLSTPNVPTLSSRKQSDCFGQRLVARMSVDCLVTASLLNDIVLGAFAKLRESTIGFVTSVCPSYVENSALAGRIYVNF